jgi:hypothetical protein
MRKLLVLIAAFQAACGGGGSAPSYAVRDQAVAFRSGSSCPVTGSSVTVGASVAILDVTDYSVPSACTSMQGNTVALNGAAGGLIIVRAAFSPAGGTVNAPGLTPGNYSFFDLATIATGGVPPLDAQGNAAFFTGAVAKCGSSAGPSTGAAINGGTVTITSVDDSTGAITGSVNARSPDGSFSGSFTTTSACTGTFPDICTAIGNLSLNLLQPICASAG